MCRRPYVDNGAWLRELVWVGGCVAAAAWASGPSVLASRGHGAVDVVGPVALPGRTSGRGDKGVYTDRRKRPLGAVLGHLCTLLRRCGQTWGTKECTQIGENGPSAPFRGICVHCCVRTAPRAASGGTSVPTAMACQRRPLAGRLLLGRETRLCASVAAASLASLLRRSLTQTPEEPNGA